MPTKLSRQEICNVIRSGDVEAFYKIKPTEIDFSDSLIYMQAAIDSQSVAMVKVMIDHNARLVDEEIVEGKSAPFFSPAITETAKRLPLYLLASPVAPFLAANNIDAVSKKNQRYQRKGQDRPYWGTVFHLAAREANLEILRALVLFIGEKKIATNLETPDHRGKTAIDIAKEHPDKKIKDAMVNLLEVAKLPTGQARKSALASIRMESFLEKKSIDFSGNYSGQNKYKESPELYKKLQEKMEEDAESSKKERQGFADIQQDFLRSVRAGALTEDVLAQYIQNGGRIDARENGGHRRNALEIAVEEGNFDVFKILIKGVGVDISGAAVKNGSSNIDKVIGFSTDHDKLHDALKLASDFLAKNPNNAGYKNIVNELEDMLKPKSATTKASAAPINAAGIVMSL